ncbi:MAG: twitching motility protein PilT [Bacteroidetes bacterium 43-16]|nr:MAG: twitching motility protein PilT [Bacteroidetes bacterium 43-16]
MNIFVDANILVSVLNKEYPLFTYTSRILSLASHRKYKVFTSPLCLGIAYYFAEKKCKSTARQKLDLLIEHLSITTIDEKIVRRIKNNKAIQDFEDGMEYYSALRAKCDCIITQDLNDFYFSEIEVFDAENFINRYFGS